MYSLLHMQRTELRLTETVSVIRTSLVCSSLQTPFSRYVCSCHLLTETPSQCLEERLTTRTRLQPTLDSMSTLEQSSADCFGVVHALYTITETITGVFVLTNF